MMTAEEALALPRGSVVQTKVGGRWAEVEVLGVGSTDYGGRTGVVARLTARRINRTRAGWHFPAITRLNYHVRKSPNHDRVPANVYADFLDERGEHRAAALLREAFPLGPG